MYKKHLTIAYCILLTPILIGCNVDLYFKLPGKPADTDEYIDSGDDGGDTDGYPDTDSGSNTDTHDINTDISTDTGISSDTGTSSDIETETDTDSETDTEPYIGPLVPPTFSHTSGFYSDDITLTFSHPDSRVTIVYTTDGSEPMIENLSGVEYSYKNQYPQNPGEEFGEFLENSYTSYIYEAPLDISDRSGEPDKLSSISSTWHAQPSYFPDVKSRKATVVRARAVSKEKSSAVVTHTYFVSSDAAFNSSLPIVSISLNEDELFDYDNGIYVAGTDFDDWRQDNPDTTTTGHTSSNYRRKGDETEKAASFQYFVDEKEVLNQNIGLRLHGSFSRSAQNKSFMLYARKEYDTQNKFKYPFFGKNNSNSFKRLILRNSGNDAGAEVTRKTLVTTTFPSVYFRDAFIQKMASHLRFDIQDYTPVVTYVNGEYWGLLNLRERQDKRYLDRKYDIEEDELDLLELNALVKEGDNTHYLMMRDYISENDLTDDECYDHVKTLMDVDNFIDYNVTQIFVRNTDWPNNNIKYFRKRTAEYIPDAPYGQDGRWRWLMYDTDFGFGGEGEKDFAHNSLRRATGGKTIATLLQRKLLQNKEFRTHFINRYADLLNTAFQPERLISIIDEMADRIADEIPFHRDRWNTVLNWTEDVEAMRVFAEKRPSYARSHIMSRFDIPDEVTVTLSVSDLEHGFVQINTIEITEDTPGVPDNPSPWTGIYFQDIPLTIKAIPKTGYAFSHWSGSSQSDDSIITVIPTEDCDLQANFVPI